MSESTKKNSKDISFVIIGVLILSFSITSILKPSGLMMGGITGISIVIATLVGIDYTYINYFLSIAVLIATYVVLGKFETGKIIVLSLFFPLVILILSRFNIKMPLDDIFLSTVYFGVVRGIGSGMVLRSGYSTGGTDSIAKILHKTFYQHISISFIITVIDLVVILSSIFIFNLKIVLYAMIAQVIYLNVSKIVMFGFGSRFMKIEIITDRTEAIETFILNDVHRGVTKVMITGAYKNSPHIKLTTICTPRESLVIKNKIAKLDPNAFISLVSTSSIWGNGSGFYELKDESEPQRN